MWETDLQGVVTWCSAEIEAALGLAAKDVVGKRLDVIGLKLASSETLARALAAGEEIRGLILEACGREGEEVALWVGAVPRLDKSGSRAGYRGVIRVLQRRRPAAATEASGAKGAPASRRAAVQTVSVASEAAGRQAETARAAAVIDEGTRLAERRVPGYRADAHSVQPVDGGSAPMASDGSRLVIPILAQERLLGVVEFSPREDGRGWSEDDRLLAEAAAQQLAVALQDARSYQLTQQALEEMREADRLKTQFLANMSHELRTPLNSIIGFSRVILKGIDGPINETQEQDLTAIYNSGQHLLGLINDILDLSRIEAGKMELAFSEVDLLEIIRSVISTAVGLVKDKPIELAVDLPEHLPPIQADSIRVRQVLLNLISNATKFTERGKVGVSAHVGQSNGRKEVVVSVFDTGPGIAPEHQAKLFEPFSQVDASPTRKTGGTGLGLSICRHLVELHGGRIWVQSALGEGSTFSFSLPVEPPQGASTEPGATPLVLAIDDDPGALELYRRHWTDPRYRLHTVLQPHEALPVARDLRPAAIVLDPLLPNNGAWQVMAGLKATPETRRIPVLLTSLHRDHERGACFGPVEWLSPPLREDDLLASLQRLSPHDRPRLSVLVICDQTEARERVRSVLEPRPEFQVVFAADAGEALAAARAQPPDAVVIDLTTSSVNGLDALEAVKQDNHARNAPLVLLAPLALTPEQQADLVHRWNSLQEQASLRPGEVMGEVRGWLAHLVRRNTVRV
ncbi:MAG: ATP-binding protein [Chloroflexota bacterium]